MIPPRRPLERIRTLAIALLIALALAAVIEELAALEPVQRALQRRFAHRADFPGNKTLELLVAQGALHPYPLARVPSVDREVVRHWGSPGRGEGAALTNLYAVRETPPELLPSTIRLPTGALDSVVPVLSVAVAPRELSDLLSRPMARGKPAERTAYVSFFRPGLPVLGFSAGIRLHGGRSRLGSENKSFRLHLRPVHGTQSLPAETFFGSREGAPTRLNSLVIHNDVRLDNFDRKWHLVNPIAYEIAHEVGALTPRTLPVKFFLNSEEQGAYVLTESLDEAYFEAWFGHDDFILARTKGSRNEDLLKVGDRGDYLEFLEWARLARTSPQSEIPLQANIDNLFRWTLSILLCGTDDMLQGPLVRDNRGPDRRWFWVNWDMDHSFMSAARRQVARPWETNQLGHLLERREPRPTLFRRLARSRQFGPRLADTFSEVLNHRVTTDYVAALLDRYRELAADLGIEERSYFDQIAEFLQRRPGILRRQMNRELRLGRSFAVQVAAPAGRSIEIDGYSKGQPFEGWYFENRPVKLDVDERDRGAFDHWQIDGVAIEAQGSALEWSVRADTRIEAIFSRHRG